MYNKKNNDFSFEDTDPEGQPLRKSKKFTIRGFLTDIIALSVILSIGYFIYFSYKTYSDYQDMKSYLNSAALLASKSSDDGKIKKYLSSYCVDYKDFYCKPEHVTIRRDFQNATVKVKYKYRFMVLTKWPLILTFHPDVKVAIE